MCQLQKMLKQYNFVQKKNLTFHSFALQVCKMQSVMKK